MRHFSWLTFFRKKDKFQPDGSNGCHDVLLMPMNLNAIAILSIHGFENCCLSKGMGLLNISFLNERSKT